MKRDARRLWQALSRREFLEGAATTGTLLALSPQLLKAQVPSRPQESRTFFFNLSYLPYSGHVFYLMFGTNRYPLRELQPGDAALARARRRNRFLAGVSDSQITHVLDGAMSPVSAVMLSYVIQDPNTTTGEWNMPSIYLVPPTSSYAAAFLRVRASAAPGEPLPLSAKRRKYGMPPAHTLQDLLDEQILLDTSSSATAMVNLHPEMLSADATSAAHIQTSYINRSPATFELSQALDLAGSALPQQGTAPDNGTGWATLVPYTDDNGNPLINSKGKNAGLILYDPKWQPTISQPWVAAAMKPALRSVKNDTTLGIDVTTNPSSVPTGALWTRHDGTTSIDQPPSARRRRTAPDNSQYTLTNITPNFNGYSCNATTTFNGNDAVVTLNFKNWYLRYLGLYIQFLTSDMHSIPLADLPSGILGEDPTATANNEILVGSLTPEFTIYGIPVEASGNSVTFTFPSDVATSAKILASGLGGSGSHTAQDTEVLGIIMTSLFNLGIPAALLALTIGTEIDIFVKTLAFPFALLVAKEIATVAEDGNQAQVLSIFWKSIVKGALTPSLKAFVAGFLGFLTTSEVVDGLEDAIPIAGEIIQAIGVLGTVAEIAETTLETQASPPTYEYDLVGTYDLTLTINPYAKDPGGFPATAATCTVTAVFDNGTPVVQHLPVAGGTKPPIVATFNNVPLGGMVTLSAGFYAVDKTLVGNGKVGPIANVPSSHPIITITELQLPITSATVYQHKQKTALDAQGNHLWVCAPAPQPPSAATNCAPAPGNICAFRKITYSPTLGNLGYGWQSYSTASCDPGGAGQLDQMANIPIANTAANAQAGYSNLPCALSGATELIYDPLGRAALNFYVDTSNNVNLLRQVTLGPAVFSDPRLHQAWGSFTLPPDDMLLHPSGAVITINTVQNRLEMLKVPSTPLSDADAGTSLRASLHGGFGLRPGLFSAPMAATITSDGVILIIESGNNRIHALDASGNPVRHFVNQTEPYFLPLTATGGSNTQYLDIAVEFSGLIYVLSISNGVYRLDIYPPDLAGSTPLSTTLGFNAAKVTVDYWRNVYSLNYEVLMNNGALPASGVTEPSLSQWLPLAPPPCGLRTPPFHPRPIAP